MPLFAVLFLAVLALAALLVVAPFALLYFVFSRVCDLLETFFESLPWVNQRRKKQVKKGLGLATLRDIFSKLQNVNPKSSPKG